MDADTAAVLDEETEEDFDWRAELMQLEQENKRNEVSSPSLSDSMQLLALQRQAFGANVDLPKGYPDAVFSIDACAIALDPSALLSSAVSSLSGWFIAMCNKNGGCVK